MTDKGNPKHHFKTNIAKVIENKKQRNKAIFIIYPNGGCKYLLNGISYGVKNFEKIFPTEVIKQTIQLDGRAVL